MLHDRRPCAGQPGQRRAPLPPFLYSEHVAAFLRFEAPLPNMLYVFGGRNRRHGPVSLVEMLDTWHGEWVSCPSMPRKRAGGAAAALPDGRMLVVGGYDERGIAAGLLSACDVYDPLYECWGEAAPLRRARWGHGCAGLCGKVYAVGGCSVKAGARAPLETFMETLRSCEAYDPVADRWEECGQLQVARSGCRLVALGSRRLAAVGGCDDVFGRAETQATVEVFELSTGTWAILSQNMAQPRTSAAVAAIDARRCFIAGGAPSQRSAEVFLFDADARVGAPSAGSESNEANTAAEGVSESPRSMCVADMMEGRMGCQAAVVRLPSGRSETGQPSCDREYVLVVGGERCEEDPGDGAATPQQPNIRQLDTAVAYDLDAGGWKDSDFIPPMAMARTTVSLCLGAGRVAAARLVARGARGGA